MGWSGRALVGGLLVVVVVLSVVLADRATRLAGSNNAAAEVVVPDWQLTNGRWCQRDEIVPGGTAALRLFVVARGRDDLVLDVTIARHRALLARGARTVGWRGRSVTVALRPRVTRDTTARVCLHVRAAATPRTPRGASSPPSGAARVAILGPRPSADPAAPAPPRRLRIDYLRAGRESWWSLAPTTIARIGLGHAWRGPTVALAIAASTLVAIALALRLLWRETR